MRIDATQISAWIQAYFATPNGTDPAKMADHIVELLAERGAFDDSTWGTNSKAIIDPTSRPAAESNEGSAVGDVVKVPTHWHVKFSATASPKTGAAVLPGDGLEFVYRGEPQYATIEHYAREDHGLVIFDVVLPFPLPANTEARFRLPRAGIADTATVVSAI